MRRSTTTAAASAAAASARIGGSRIQPPRLLTKNNIDWMIRKQQLIPVRRECSSSSISGRCLPAQTTTAAAAAVLRTRPQQQQQLQKTRVCYFGSGSSSSSSSSAASVSMNRTSATIVDDDDDIINDATRVVVGTGTTASKNNNATTPTTASSTVTREQKTNIRQHEKRQQQQQKPLFVRKPIVYIPSMTDGTLKYVPSHIEKPPYGTTGIVPYNRLTEEILLHTPETASKMKDAAQLAARVLQLACTVAQQQPGTITTDDIDTIVHDEIIRCGAYPSPLNYAQFPKSVCTSINEIICHGIPDGRPLQVGDVVSFDVSCYYNGVHGDNCATIIVGDCNNNDTNTNNNTKDENESTNDNKNNTVPPTYSNSTTNVDWRGVPYKTNFDSVEEREHFVRARRLVNATRESLYAGIRACSPGGCLSSIGTAIEDVADQYGYKSIRKYRGHGISHIFHTAPFLKHYKNADACELRPGMIFTIEPMLVDGMSDDCFEWESDNWTVQCTDSNALAAQFEHTIYITEHDVQILTLPY